MYGYSDDTTPPHPTKGYHLRPMANPFFLENLGPWSLLVSFAMMWGSHNLLAPAGAHSVLQHLGSMLKPMLLTMQKISESSSVSVPHIWKRFQEK